MPAAAGDAAGVKLVGIQPANPARGLPIIQGVYVLFDMRIGQPVALFDGAALTTLRTPMISALATDALARADARSLGVIGTGPQAVAHVRAVRVVRPDLESVVVAGRTAAHVDRVVDELVGRRRVGDRRVAMQTPRRATSSARRHAPTAPCSASPMCDPGAHVNLVGSYRLDLREVAADLVAASTVAVDDLAAAKAEAGDLHLAVAEGAWSWDRIAGDLTDLASGRLRRTSDERDHPFQERRTGRAGPGHRPTRSRGGWNHRGLMSKAVVIVGGGLVGFSSALFLTEAGAEVTIIDSGALGGGAARGNAGFMCTAIVEPLPAPGAIGNALKSLRDPAARPAGTSEGHPADDPVAAGVRPQLHGVALQVGSCRARTIQPQQCRHTRTPGHLTLAGLMLHH